MRLELRPEGPAVEAALLAWRRKAADVLLIAATAVHLPGLVLLMLGHGPPMAPWVRGIAIPLYAVLAASALLRRVEYRTRLCVLFFAAYLWVAVTNLAAPRGPYAQVGLVTLPLLALVFFGARAARMAILASATVFVSAAFLRVLPGVTRTLAVDPSHTTGPWMQAAMLAIWLVGLMVLLGLFQQFLLNALVAQYRATEALEREAVERLAAQRKVENEMRERQRLEREIAAIGDGERRRLGQELHDGVCQQITAALLRCQALDQRVERGEALSATDFEALSSLLAETIDEAHNVAVGLCPLDPDPDALAPALRALAKRVQHTAAVRCDFLAVGDVRVPDPEAAQHLYRIAQEALSNAARHAHASRIAVELRGSDGELTLEVEDDGAGMPGKLPAGGMGLRTMAYRAQILKGELTVASAPGGGTRVGCRVPRLASASTAGHHPGDTRCIPSA